MKRHQPTILDIARELGISKSTVSRALTGSPNILPETRQRILETAQRLDYQPNLLAQSLIRSETHLLGVVIPDIEKPFYARIVSGIQHMASQTGYRVIITQSNESPEVEVQNVQALMLSRVDGLLICHTRATRSFEHVKLIHRKGIPMVSFARVCDELPVPKIVENDREGARAVVGHLVERGYRRIAVLAGPADLLASNLRLQGYRDALQTANLPVDESRIAHTDYTREQARRVVADLMSCPTDRRPDALFAVYDAGVIEVLLWLKESGYSAPDDLALAGFGDDPSSSLVEPGITTYHQNPHELGRTACRLLLDTLAGGTGTTESADQTHLTPGYLVIRKSC